MKVITGRVVGGKIELEAELEEGTPVAVLAQDEAGFRFTVEQEEELASALAAIRRGEYADGHQLLAELKGRKAG
jgi:hypothetical protein